MKKLETNQMESFVAADSIGDFCTTLYGLNLYGKYKCIIRLGGEIPASNIEHSVSPALCAFVGYISSQAQIPFLDSVKNSCGL